VQRRQAEGGANQEEAQGASGDYRRADAAIDFEDTNEYGGSSG